MHFLFFCFLFFNAFKKSHLKIFLSSQMAKTSSDFLTEAKTHYKELPYLISTSLRQVKLLRERIITAPFIVSVHLSLSCISLCIFIY